MPDVRRHAVGRTRLESQEDLDAFASLVEAIDSLSLRHVGVEPLADYVRHLELPYVSGVHGRVDDPEDLEDMEPVATILRECQAVKTLECKGMAALCVLLHARQTWFLPELEALVVREFQAGLSMGRSTIFMAHLRRFPFLRRLFLQVRQRDRHAFSALVPSTASTAVSSPITSLCLQAGESLGMQSAADFIADFARLTQLEITVTARVDLGRFLQACPVTLTALTIHLVDDREPIHVEADLGRFVHLSTLKLGACTYAPSCELFDVLCAHLPRLREVTLKRGTRLVADKVLNFVLARGGSSGSLEHLVLDSIVAVTDPSPSQNTDHPDVASGMLDLSSWWGPPAWTPSFTLADARALIAAAEHAGVQLEGSTVRAVEYDAVLAREERYLLGRRDEVLEAVRGLFGEGDGEA